MPAIRRAIPYFKGYSRMRTDLAIAAPCFIEERDIASERIEDEDSLGRSIGCGGRGQLKKKNSEQAQKDNRQITGATMHKSSPLPQ
jgi:hypothetical protein